ncbi:MAG: hypothetical protein AAF479_12625, partial [Pseudomonadota bacterium]
RPSSSRAAMSTDCRAYPFVNAFAKLFEAVSASLEVTPRPLSALEKEPDIDMVYTLVIDRETLIDQRFNVVVS